MRNLLLFMFAALLAVPGFAQLNCNNVSSAISLSASGAVVTLTNSSVPTSTTNIYTTYNIHWGDNTTTTTGNNNNVTHTYNTSGTYTVTMYTQVLDSINNILCLDTASANITVTASLNCNNVNASFNAYVSGGNTGVLVNYSTPVAGPKLSVQYLINWGDGSTPTATSSKSNQTHVYSSGGTYTIKLYVTAHDSNNNITCVDSTAKNLTINGGGSLNCNTVKAAFSKTVSGSVVTLINNSTPNPGSGISASYKIYWGDGSSTTKTNKSNTSHSYANGSYTIQLVATYTAGTTTCIDSISDSVNINVTPPNNISGMVYLDSSQINVSDSVMIWLITFDSSTNLLTAIDSQKKPAYYPLYNFQNKAAGQYRTKAKLLNGQTSGAGYVPTYHDSDLLWSNANIITHTGGTTSGKHIYLKTGTVTAGPGFVGGNVTQGANKGTANGIEGMTIFLLNTANEPVAYAITDANGDYSFSNVPVGSYTVHPENINYNTTPASINISLTHTAHLDINFERSHSQKTIVPISAGIGNVNDKASFTAYPNPATDVININWGRLSNDMATISITDISGKKVHTSEVKMDVNAAINISNIRPGFYFLNVQTEYGSNTQKLLIQ
ncbi:MAG: T9SS type A sorting domain-containing protein [Taibaiella sp.]|nr:T9SS type A sorting domain-containing protein [Taibaiella sp.]